MPSCWEFLNLLHSSPTAYAVRSPIHPAAVRVWIRGMRVLYTWRNRRRRYIAVSTGTQGAGSLRPGEATPRPSSPRTRLPGQFHERPPAKDPPSLDPAAGPPPAMAGVTGVRLCQKRAHPYPARQFRQAPAGGDMKATPFISVNK